MEEVEIYDNINNKKTTFTKKELDELIENLDKLIDSSVQNGNTKETAKLINYRSSFVSDAEEVARKRK